MQGSGYTRAVIALLPVLLGVSSAWAADSDHDGIRGRQDACPDVAEVVNAYRDDDGCPDALGTVTVRVVDIGGDPVRNARVRLGSVYAEVGAEGVSVFPDRMPGSVVGLSVSAPGYLASDVPDLEIPEGDIERVVLLDWVPTAVHVSAVDATSGLPVDASIRWDGPGHLPSERTGPDGEARFDARPGRWRVRAEADHFAGAETWIEVTQQGAPDHTFALVPSWSLIADRWIAFGVGAAVLTEDATALLDDLAGDLFAFPEVLVTVEGHADADNDALSLRRAEAVRAALLAAGADETRVDVRDLAEAVPFASPWTSDGRMANRAVRFAWASGPSSDALMALSVPFAEDTAALGPEGDDVVAAVVAAMRARPEGRLEVMGHRDPSEGALSVARAMVVRDYLLARGVAPERLFAVGLRSVAGLDGGVGFRLRAADETVTLGHEVFFGTGSAAISEAGAGVLADAARRLIKHPAMRAVVGGGGGTSSDDVAVLRVRAVVQALIGAGVASGQLLSRPGDDDQARVTLVALPPPLLSHERLRFEPGRSELGDDADDVLRGVARILAIHPGISVGIVGLGTPVDGGRPVVLGKLRALRVRERLLSLGTDPARLEVLGEEGDVGEGEVRFSVMDLGVAAAVVFDDGSASLTPPARLVLDGVVPTLLLADVPVHVVAHVGVVDPAGVSASVAHARAEAVSEYLVRAGVALARVVTTSQPAEGGEAEGVTVVARR